MKTAKCNRKVVKFGPHLFIHLLFFHSFIILSFKSTNTYHVHTYMYQVLC